MNTTTKYISTFSLTLLITGAVDGITNLPSIALFGEKLVFFFVVAALLFLLPAGLMAAELTCRFPKESGIYAWTRLAFGEKKGLLSVWLQWINTMVWFPTCLSTFAGNLAYLLNPQFAQNKYYLIGVCVGVFWFMTFINLKGVKLSARFASVASTVGMVLPIFIIIFFSAIWVLSGKPLAAHLTTQTIFPSLHHANSWVSLTAIITSFLGMELAAVHAKGIENAHRVFPKALLFSVMIIVLTMGLGSFGLSLVVPRDQIQLVNGTLQAFYHFLSAYHLVFLMPLFTLLLLIGSLGSLTNWIISPAQGVLHAAKDGLLPGWLSQENKHGAAKNVLFFQGVVVSIVCSVFFLMPSINGSYWFLIDLSTQLYVMMYVLMFLAAVVLGFKTQSVKNHIIPGGKFGYWLTALAGLTACFIALIVGFFKPDGINVGSAFHYEALFVGGLLLMLSPVVGFSLYSFCRRSRASF